MGRRIGNTRQPFETLPELVEDDAARESQDRLRQFLNGLLFSRFEGDHFEITITREAGISPQTTFSYPHNFRFIPKDIWITSQIPTTTGESVSVVYASTDRDSIVFDVSAVTSGESVTVRFFAGVFVEEV